jgi:hypothetical protein
MSRGVLLFAFNNEQIDYIKQAHFLALRIGKHLGLPTSIVTDVDVRTKYSQYAEAFDKVIQAPAESFTNKRYNDGSIHKVKLSFKNTGRECSYDLSPYDETIVMDTDYIINNNTLNQCFVQQKDLLLYKDATHIGIHDQTSEFQTISDTSVDFYWATVIFFRKTEVNKKFFDLVKHIKENYWHYRNVFQFSNTTYRNDFAFSIAVHIMNGYMQGDFVGKMPGKKFYAIDRDILVKIKNNEFVFLIEKKNRYGEYTLTKIKDSNIHIMNKFSLERCIDDK